MRSAFRVVLMFVAVSIVGYLLSFKLEVQLTPKPLNNKIFINYTWPETNPLLVEASLTSPFENTNNQPDNDVS